MPNLNLEKNDHFFTILFRKMQLEITILDNFERGGNCYLFIFIFSGANIFARKNFFKLFQRVLIIRHWLDRTEVFIVKTYRTHQGRRSQFPVRH